jgi:hypothetical protein
MIGRHLNLSDKFGCPSSSAPIKREYPATSAARIAVRAAGRGHGSPEID